MPRRVDVGIDPYECCANLEEALSGGCAASSPKGRAKGRGDNTQKPPHDPMKWSWGGKEQQRNGRELPLATGRGIWSLLRRGHRPLRVRWRFGENPLRRLRRQLPQRESQGETATQPGRAKGCGEKLQDAAKNEPSGEPEGSYFLSENQPKRRWRMVASWARVAVDCGRSLPDSSPAAPDIRPLPTAQRRPMVA